MRDLLSKDPKNKLEVKEHKDSGVYVKGLNAFVVKGVPELRNVLEVRKGRRLAPPLAHPADGRCTACPLGQEGLAAWCCGLALATACA